MGNSNGSAIGALRLLRLLRLLTFVKGVPQLRVIVSGLLVGLRSVTYIVMLLFLVIYLFAIMVNHPQAFNGANVASLSPGTFFGAWLSALCNPLLLFYY